jgi:3-isopropylmalate/(R)-2-methylmalate dehydratase small subunit
MMTDQKKKEFILNQDPYRSSNIIVAGDNFGCGSSREHAPWALSDFGIKCIISTSFADIFYNNSFKNGVLPIQVTAEQREALLADAKDKENPELEIDLPSQEIRRPNGAVIKFELDPFRKKCLLEGLDDIGITLEKSKKIDDFEIEMENDRPWL